MKLRKNTQSMYQKEKHVDLLLTGEGEKKNNVLIKDFNRFMYDHSLLRGRKHFVIIVYMMSLQKKF